ncbi:MAG TPA: hypothetical protein PKY82_25410 [Pyrinomonadaceae bacterium]|nr:hypothetical protein [Pyrinomonadaceae bacterium]
MIKNCQTEKSPMTLKERIKEIDPLQARRFEKLSGTSLEIATEGIIRHLRACRRMNVSGDPAAVREILDDALKGQRVFAHTNEDVLIRD